MFNVTWILASMFIALDVMKKSSLSSAFFLTTSHTHLTHICEKSKFMIARCYLPGFWHVTILRDTFLLYIFI